MPGSNGLRARSYRVEDEKEEMREGEGGTEGEKEGERKGGIKKKEWRKRRGEEIEMIEQMERIKRKVENKKQE